MPDFRRGMNAMNEAQEERQAGGKFTPFCRQIVWNDDQETKYIAFLNRAEDIPSVELHSFIPVGHGESKTGKKYTKYEQFISRVDPAIGEDYDDLSERLEQKANLRTLAAAVELEPTYSTVNGRKRPTGFTVKTETFQRKTEEGGMEEVEAPLIGVIVQAPSNFFGWVGSFNDSTAPIEETPLQVIRRGKDAKTAYDFTPYLDQPIDYSPLLDLIENVAYLKGVDIDLSDDERDSAIAIGNALLDKKLEELADGERYERLVSPITHIEDRFGGGASKAPKATSARQSRPARQSPREAVAEPQEAADEPTETPKPAGKNGAKFAALREKHESVA